MTRQSTIQQQMKAKLEQAGIPYKQIECYGSQIVITSHCEKTARRWAFLLSHFSRVRGVIKALDDAQVNKGSVLCPSTVVVWRTFARIE